MDGKFELFPTYQRKLAFINRLIRGVMLGLIFTTCTHGTSLATEMPESIDFGFQNVIEQAKVLAAEEFRRPESRVPAFLLKQAEDDTKAYDVYRDIRFRKDEALWRDSGLPFQVHMFHLGLHYKTPVAIHVIDNGSVEEVAFSTRLFDYGQNDFVDKIPKDLGFAGFRIHTPLNDKATYDEVIVFLGASYFRAVAQNQHYGLSARGLAVDTALPSGEEFPFYKSFWLVKPQPEDTMIVIYALLDSPSIAGAYRFEVTPGSETTTDVEAYLYPRKAINKLGIAPLTSMYYYGENTLNKPADFRPEVHDSDGLMIHTNTGEWIWRPIQNHRNLLVNSFELNNPRGFGLSQRDRNFDHYQDLEARYDNRPSAWILPKGEWGEGRVELIQIPTPDEYHDNIVAFWVPKKPAKPGDSIHYVYRLIWYRSHPERPGGGYVTATRIMPGREGGSLKFVLDFKGRELDALPADSSVEAIVNVGEGGKLLEQQIHKNEMTQGWRLVFQAQPEHARPMELRASLKHGQDFLTETWSYVVEP
jgi:glucans biosynthesis protein